MSYLKRFFERETSLFLKKIKSWVTFSIYWYKPLNNKICKLFNFNKMKNAFKLGFLGLALTVAFASCGETGKKSDAATDSANTALDSANTALDSANTALDSAKTAVDSAKTAVDSTKAAH